MGFALWVRCQGWLCGCFRGGNDETVIWSVLLVFVGTAGWRIGEALSPDALSMAVGVLFGVMAGVPTALLVMAGNRRRDNDERREESRPRSAWANGGAWLWADGWTIWEFDARLEYALCPTAADYRGGP